MKTTMTWKRISFSIKMIEWNTNQRKADIFIDCYLSKELQAAVYLLALCI